MVMRPLLVQDIIVEQLDHNKPMNIKALTRMSRGIDFARFHNTSPIHELDPLGEKVCRNTCAWCPACMSICIELQMHAGA